MTDQRPDPIGDAEHDRNLARDELRRLDAEFDGVKRRFAQRIADAKTRLQRAKQRVVDLSAARDAAQQQGGEGRH